jgi:hypothetical protein
LMFLILSAECGEDETEEKSDQRGNEG